MDIKHSALRLTIRLLGFNRLKGADRLSLYIADFVAQTPERQKLLIKVLPQYLRSLRNRGNVVRNMALAKLLRGLLSSTNKPSYFEVELYKNKPYCTIALETLNVLLHQMESHSIPSSIINLINPIVKIASSHYEPTMQIHALAILSKLAKCRGNIHNNLLENKNDLLTFLVLYLSDGNNAVQSYASLALGNLCIGSPMMISEVFNRCSTRRLEMQLKNSNKNVYKNAVYLISRISYTKEASELKVICSAAILTSLLEFLASNDTMVKINVLRTLKNLSNGPQEMKDNIISTGATDNLKPLLTSSDLNIYRLTKQCLENIGRLEKTTLNSDSNNQVPSLENGNRFFKPNRNNSNVAIIVRLDVQANI